ncbi:hypothetical protein Acr_24g0012170 [Actinidia rufa]|uniref:Uncharacterized protein n=1 Tax=Actinidia rufa TaxID=165716 RepID=A0A7J0GW01_9ERIC|nr:hypothetical protein Acr_24g0012170 [Actinidia rufa]
MQTLFNTSLARVEVPIKLSLRSELGGPLCRSSEQSLSKINIVRAKAFVTYKVPLLNELGTILRWKLGRGATADSIPKGCHGTEGDLNVRVPSDSPHARMETSTVDE